MTLNGKKISFLVNSLKLSINEDLTVMLRLDGLKVFYEFFTKINIAEELSLTNDSKFVSKKK